MDPAGIGPQRHRGLFECPSIAFPVFRSVSVKTAMMLRASEHRMDASTTRFPSPPIVDAAQLDVMDLGAGADVGAALLQCVDDCLRRAFPDFTMFQPW